MVVTVNAEKVVKHAHIIERVYSLSSSQSIKDELRVVLLGGLHGRTSIWSVLWLKCTENGRWPPVISDNGTRSCANRISYTHTHTHTHTGLTLSRQFADCVHVVDRQYVHVHAQKDRCRGGAGQCVHVVNRRYAHAHRDRGGADSCAFGRCGADSMTFDLKTK